MKTAHVKIGALYWTRIGESKALVRVVCEALSIKNGKRTTQFRVARADDLERRVLPKARSAATLHIRSEQWGGFTEKQDTEATLSNGEPALMRSGDCLQSFAGRDASGALTYRYVKSHCYEATGREVAISNVTIGGVPHIVFRCADGHLRAQPETVATVGDNHS